MGKFQEEDTHAQVLEEEGVGHGRGTCFPRRLPPQGLGIYLDYYLRPKQRSGYHVLDTTGLINSRLHPTHMNAHMSPRKGRLEETL